MSSFALVGDRLHAFPAFEECNLEGADVVEHIDEATALALLTQSSVTVCEHCEPKPEAPTLNTRSDAP